MGAEQGSDMTLGPPGTWSGAAAGDVSSHEVLDLLQLRESAALPGWVAHYLWQALDAADARVLRVFPIGATRQPEQARPEDGLAVSADDDHALPAPIDADGELARAIRARRIVRGEGSDGAGRLLVPLAAMGEVRYVVEVAEPVADAPRNATVNAMLEVVGRYFERLVESETDPLTRLWSRRLLYPQLSHALRKLGEGARPHFLAVADIDHFKTINDRYGHLHGDETLIQFARLLRRTFRASDQLYRFGGEEFVVVFGAEREDDGIAALERLRSTVLEHEFPNVGQVTVSIGFTRIHSANLPPTTLLHRADHAVYFAKSNGRNQVCQYEVLVECGAIAAVGASAVPGAIN